MKNRLLTADRIHDGRKWLPLETVIEVAPDGTIISVREQLDDEEAEYFEGILTPGFINVHCHLELSHMKGTVPEETGLIPFLQTIPTQRNNFTDEQKKAARIEAYEQMVNNGIVAVGDIANSSETLDLRMLQKLHMHTFVECIGFTEAFAQARLDYSVNIVHSFAEQQEQEVRLRQSVIPHAPYSVSGPLFRLINHYAPESIISIHNQESLAEDEYYKNKTGAVRNLLAGLGINDDFFQATGKSSLQSYLPFLSASHPLILVHNTKASEDDVHFAMAHSSNLFWCLCPNANWYIERSMPDVEMLSRHTENICIGTDSLASNHLLSVQDELLALNENFPDLSWEVLIRWGTLNGAKALQMEDILGSFEVGKKPGIVLLRSTFLGPVTRLV